MVITHGVTGGSETNYIRHAVLKAMKNGYRVVVFNNRGVAGSPLKVKQTKIMMGRIFSENAAGLLF